MSRIGKVPLALPAGVQVSKNGTQLLCKGPMGQLQLALADGVEVAVDGSTVTVTRTGESRLSRAMHGTTRALLKNMVDGVTKGYSKKLEVVGVGYKATLQGKKVLLNVGFANTIEVIIPEGVKVELPDPTHINVSGVDKQAVGQLAATIRAARKPEPYKGKGVRYVDEVVRKKAGKSAAAGAAGAKK